MSNERMEFDIIIIGAGPAGLSAAIRLAQLNQHYQKNLSICVLEKGSQVGAHILSGAAIDPRALNELIPNWQQLGAPLLTPAEKDEFYLLTQKTAWRLPIPSSMKNKGNYIISLGNFCCWLSQQAEALGVQIFPGFPAANLLFDTTGKVCGVKTQDQGIDKEGHHTSRFQAGIELYGKQILIAEGCHGSLAKQLIERFDLRKNSEPTTYGIGIKELWEIPAENHQPGKVIHTMGWPLDAKTYGGSFIYHLENNQVAAGIIIGLDYKNPYLDPYEEFQRFKTHPTMRKNFIGGKRISYGARALAEGGWQALPKLMFPGGMLIGDSAGFLNVARIKGTHTNMKSGMLAAETIFAAINKSEELIELTEYVNAIKNSWLGDELYRARNIRPAFKKGLWFGLIYAGIDTYLFKGLAPWTFKYRQSDYASLEAAKNYSEIHYPAHDNQLTFNKLDSVYLANTSHDENQPCHLKLINPEVAIHVNYEKYHSPETRYCPAGVYEIIFNGNQPKLQINAANCVHCKTCDIKDPKQNINWTTPEGGSGPNYTNM